MEISRDDFVIAIRSAFLKKGTQQRFSLLGLIFFSIIFLVLGSLNFKVINYLKIGITDPLELITFPNLTEKNLEVLVLLQLSNIFSQYLFVIPIILIGLTALSELIKQKNSTLFLIATSQVFKVLSRLFFIAESIVKHHSYRYCYKNISRKYVPKTNRW